MVQNGRQKYHKHCLAEAVYLARGARFSARVNANSGDRNEQSE
jgi:hypothetical protein